MAFCGKKVDYPYFTVTHLNRDGIKCHYAFIGLAMKKKYNDILNSDKKELIKDFGSFNVNLWFSVNKNNEKLIFLDNRIWLDDTIFNIKLKLFLVLSEVNINYVIPDNQQLWIKVDNKNKILGYEFYNEDNKDITYYNYEPAIYSKPVIDNNFLTEDDENLLKK